LYWALGQISLIIVPDLQFLTAARSQVRFDVGANVFIWGLVGGLCIPACHDVSSTCLDFRLYPRLLHSQGGADSSHGLTISLSFNSYAPMHGRVTYHQIPLYVWAFEQALAPSCPRWQSSSLGTLIESRRTCMFHVDVGLPSLNPILILSHLKLCQFTAWASPPNVICWYNALLLNSLKVNGIASLHLLAPYHVHHDCNMT
jgi:hypothetical protein